MGGASSTFVGKYPMQDLLTPKLSRPDSRAMTPAEMRRRARVIASAPRFAVISDIHGNLEALRAVLADLRRRGVSGVICLGDIAGYGPQAHECLELLRLWDVPCLRGNHEEYVGGSGPLPWELSIEAAEAAVAGRRELPAADRRRLRCLPWTFEAGGFAFVHASYPDPSAWCYVREERDAAVHLAAQPTPVSFHGHTHRQGGWREGEAGMERLAGERIVRLRPDRRAAFNPGSVGQPRDGDPRAAFLICDRERGRIEFRRVRYAVASAVRAYRAAGREEMGLRLKVGR